MPNTLEETVQDKIVTTLSDAVAELAIDGRSVTVQEDLDDACFKQRGIFPLVAVLFPDRTEQEEWDSEEDRIVFEVEIACIDQFKPHEKGFREGRARVVYLRKRVIDALKAAPNLNMAWLAVMPGMWEVRFGDVMEHEGNNLLRANVTLVVPVVTSEVDS